MDSLTSAVNCATMNSRKSLTKDDIMEVIRSLAQSQGFYSRLYAGMCEAKKEDPETFEHFMNGLENKHFHDAVDVVMFFET